MPFRDLPGVEPCFFKRGDYLIRIGEKLEYVYYLKRGTVHREFLTNRGVESVVSTKVGGGLIDSIIGVLVLYRKDGTMRSSNDFVAVTDCFCLKIPVATLKVFLYEHPDLLEQVIMTATQECSYLLNLYVAKSEEPAPAIMCRWILDNLDYKDDCVYLKKEYSNIVISKILNIHKVTVSRILGALKAEGVIEKTSKGIHILDMHRMEIYAQNLEKLEYS